MPIIETITDQAFEAACLNILERLGRHEMDRVNITRNGETVAVLLPPDREKPALRQEENAIRDIYGFMRGSVIIAEDIDLTAPVLGEPLDAEQGILHR